MAGVSRYEDLEAWPIADELKREVYALDRGHFSPERVFGAQQLAERSIQCSTRFIVYLKSCKKNWRHKHKS
jgi:hypothetical protein